MKSVFNAYHTVFLKMLFMKMYAKNIKICKGIIVVILLAILFGVSGSKSTAQTVVFAPGGTYNDDINVSENINILLTSPLTNPATFSGGLTGSGNFTIDSVSYNTPYLYLRGDNSAFTGSFFVNGGIININSANQLSNMGGFYFNTTPTTLLKVKHNALKTAMTNYGAEISDANLQAIVQAITDYSGALAAAREQGALATLQIAQNSDITFDSAGGTEQRISIGAGKSGAIILEDSATLNFINSSNMAISVGNNAMLALEAAADARFIFNDNTAINDGGAIYNRGVLSVNNVTATANNAGRDGGAILNFSNAVLIVDNATFSNNTAAASGGAIYNYGVSRIANSNFTGNSAVWYGGAIRNNGIMQIVDSVFTDSSANYSGAILNGGILVISGSQFNTNRTINSDGGAIRNDRFLQISDTSFTGNIAVRNGGAIHTKSALNIDTGTFSANSAVNGGAIYNDGIDAIVKITNSEFDGNTATTAGGAIFNNKGAITISDSIFKDNTAARGGAFWDVGGNTTLDNVQFINNNAIDSHGGAIGIVGSTLSIKNSTFAGNISHAQGGAIYTDLSINNLSIFGSAFANNNAKLHGGAIHHINGWLNVTNSQFSDNHADNNGGAIVNAGNAVINNSSFTDNSAGKDTGGDGVFVSGDGGAVYNSSANATLTINGSTFTNNASWRGGAVINNGGAIIISGSMFSGNHAESDGGVVYNTGKANIASSVFTNNTAGNSAGAVYNRATGEMTITGSRFENNITSFVENGNYGSGAIRNDGILTVRDSYFNANTGMRGGGLHNYDGTAYVYNSVFSGNTVSNLGGAIYNNGTLYADRIIIVNNTSGQGALYTNPGTFADIKNAVFIDNQAGNGGAICNNKGTITVTNAYFGNNTATINGGAIFSVATSSLSVNNSVFFGNKAGTGTGGAIANNGTAEITNTIFINNGFIDPNGTTGWGGAISNAAGAVLTISSSGFYGNNALKNGGAIDASGTVNLYDVSFVGNRAGNGINGNIVGGAVHIWEEGVLNYNVSRGTALISGNIVHNNISGTPQTPVSNGIYLGRGTSLNVNTAAGAVLDMRDTFTGSTRNSADKAGITVTKTGQGVWKSGMINLSSSNTSVAQNVLFTVSEGMLYLYRAGEVTNPSSDSPTATVYAGRITIGNDVADTTSTSAFILKAGAKLASGGGNVVNTNKGSIILESGSTLVFNVGGRVPTSTAMLNFVAPAGKFSAGGTLNIDLLSLGKNTGSYTLAQASNGTFSNVSALRIRGEVVSQTRLGISTYAGLSADKTKIMLMQGQFDNAMLYWRGGGQWNATTTYWSTSYNGAANQKFLHGDIVVFVGTDADENIEINAGGVQAAGMYAYGVKNFTFTGGSITLDGVNGTSLSGNASATGKLVLGNIDQTVFTGVVDFTGITGVNEFKGGINLHSGALRISDGNQLGTAFNLIKFYSRSAVAENADVVNAIKTGYSPEIFITAARDRGALSTINIAANSNVVLDSMGIDGNRVTMLGQDVNESIGGFHLEDGATLTLKNGIKAHNYATDNNALNGGILIVGSSGSVVGGDTRTLVLTAGEGARYIFENNTARDGGAIANLGYLYINKADIRNNLAQRYGGAIYNQNSGYLYLDDVKLSNNTALDRGALWNAGTAYLNDVTFTGNMSLGVKADNPWGITPANKAFGGAVYNNGTMYITGGLFSYNNAAFGGAIRNINALSINGTRFEGNIATDFGGAIRHNNNSLEIKNASFTGNMSYQYGGAIFVASDTVTNITDTNFANNIAYTHGGGIYVGSGTALNLNATGTNTMTFAGNRDGGGPSSVYFGNAQAASGTVSSLTIDVGAQAVLDMQDAMYGELDNVSLNINKNNAGLWKLGGQNIFVTANSGVVNFNVNAGTLHLYGDDNKASVLISGAGSKFNLAAGAKLEISGDNMLATSGSVSFAQGSTLGFNLANFTADTVGLDLSAGSLNIADNGAKKLNFNVELTSWRFGSYKLIEAIGFDFSQMDLSQTALTYTGSGSGIGTRSYFARLFVNGDSSNTLMVNAGLTNEVVSWNGQLNDTWNTYLDGGNVNWKTTDGSDDAMTFVPGDVINFDTANADPDEIKDYTVSVANDIIVGGMYVSGKNNYALSGEGVTVNGDISSLTGAALGYKLVLGAKALNANTIDPNAVFSGVLDFTGITGTNAFKDGVDIYSGTLRIANAGQLGAYLNNLRFLAAADNAKYDALKAAMGDNEDISAMLANLRNGGDLPTLSIGGNVFFDSAAGVNHRLVIADNNIGSIHAEDGGKFTIRNNNSGNANGGAINVGVGGVLVLSADGTGQFVFENNQSGNRGGAIYNTGTLHIENAVFAKNQANTAGAIFNNNTVLNINNSIFTENATTAASGRGGAILGQSNDEQYGVININNSIFSYNQSVGGGAIYVHKRNELNISNSKFNNNTALTLDTGAVSSFGILNITDSDFTDNAAGGIGGAVSFVYGGTFNLNVSAGKQSLFSGNIDNTANTAKANGIYLSGGEGDIYFNVNTAESGILNMLDPLSALVPNNDPGSIFINKNGAGTWKLGGENNFDVAGTATGKYEFNVNEGSLYLYREGEVINPNRYNATAVVGAATINLMGQGSSFTLAGGAVMQVNGGNAISAANGVINFNAAAGVKPNALLGFDIANYTAATTGLTLNAATVNITTGNKLNFDVKLSSWNTGTFILVDSAQHDFGTLDLAAANLIYDLAGNYRRYAELHYGGTGNRQLLVNAMDNASLALTWNGSATDWSGSQYWLTSNNAIDFADKDTVVFDGRGNAAVNVTAGGVTVSGMQITGGSYTFSGGTITGATAVLGGYIVTDGAKKGTGRLDLSTTGTTTINTATNFANGATLSAGVLALGHTQALGVYNGANSGRLTVTGNAALKIDGDLSVNNHFKVNNSTLTLQIANGKTFTVNNVTNTGALGAWEINNGALAFAANGGSLALNNNNTSAVYAVSDNVLNLDFRNLQSLTISGNKNAADSGGIKALGQNGVNLTFGNGALLSDNIAGYNAPSKNFSGGAIHARSETGAVNLTFGANIVIRGNKAVTNESSGGGIFVTVNGASAFNIVFGNNAVISGNEASAYGGAIFASARTANGESVITLGNGAVITQNKSQLAGGAIHTSGASQTVNIGANAVITGNVANGYGGAIAVAGNAASSLTIGSGALISGNYSLTGNGGALVSHHNINISGNTLITGNLAGGQGGAIAAAGAGSANTVTLNAQGGHIAFYDNKSGVTFTGGVPNAGTGVSSAIHLIANTELMIKGDGNVYMHDAVTSGDLGGNSLTKIGAGFVQFNGASTLNAGNAAGGAVAVNGGVFRVVTGASFATGGNNGALFTVGIDGTLAGGGVITSGNGFVINGTISPDADFFEVPTGISSTTPGAARTDVANNKKIATLSLTGDVKLDAAIFKLDLDGATQTSDKLNITGALTFGGQSTISLSQWQTGTFTIISATSVADITDKFAVKLGNGALSDRQWAQVVKDGNDIKLTTDLQNLTMTWRGATDDQWNYTTAGNWSGADDSLFFARDYAVFTVQYAGDVVVADSVNGVLTAGMEITGGDYSFSGGKISGGLAAAGNNPTATGVLAVKGGSATFANALDFAGGITIANGAGLKLASGGSFADNMAIVNAGSLIVENSAAQTITNNITGAGNFTKTGNGALTLALAQGYTGITNISGGSLIISAANALQNSSHINLTGGQLVAGNAQTFKDVTSAAGTVIDMDGYALTADDIVIGGTLKDTASLSVNSADISGALEDVVALTLNSGVISGDLTRVGTVTKNGAGLLNISKTNTVGALNVNNGGLIVANGTALTVTGNAVFGATTAINVTANPNAVAITADNITFNGGVLNISGFNKTVYGEYVTLIEAETAMSGALGYNINQNTNKDYLTAQVRRENNKVDAFVGLAWYDSHMTNNAYTYANGTFSIAGGDTFTVDTALNTRTGSFSTGWSGRRLTKADAGTLILTAANGYEGLTLITGGTLALSGAGSIANSSGVQINAGTFSIAAATGNISLKALNGAGGVTLGANSLSVAAGEYSGVISGQGGLTVTGNFKLNDANTYTGATAVTGGTLTLTAQNAIGQSSLVNLTGGDLTATQNQTFLNLTTAAGTTVDFSGTNNHNLTVSTAAEISGALQNIGTFTTGALNVYDSGLLQNIATVTAVTGDIAGMLADIDHLTLGAGSISGTLTGVGALTKNTTGVLAINNNITVGALNVTGGGLTITADKLVNVSGAAQFANGATLTLTLADGYTPLTVNGLLTFDDGSALNIANFSGASYGYKQIIAHGKGGISGMPDSNITGLDTGADYLTTQLNKISMSEGEALEAAVGLTWYDTLTSATGYANAHGTFTVADGGSFTVDAALNKRTGSFDKGWDGASLTKAGNGTLTLTAVNGYDGTTTLTGGTLALSGAGSIANSSGLTISAGTFNIAGLGDGVTAATATLKSLNGATGAVTLGANTLAINAGSFGGVISGTGGLTKSNTGTLTLGGVNTYAGATYVTGGTLALTAQNAVTQSSLVNLQSGSITATANQNFKNLTTVLGTTIDFGGTNNHDLSVTTAADIAGTLQNASALTAASLTLSGTLKNITNATITSGTLNGTLDNITTLTINEGALGGTVARVDNLVKNGAGKELLINTNGVFGNISVGAGTLKINGGNTVGVTDKLVFAGNTGLVLTASNTAALTAKTAEFGANISVNVAGFSGVNYGDYVTLVSTTHGITGLPVNYAVAGGGSAKNYLTVQIVTLNNNKDLAAMVNLAWNDRHLANGIYDLAHGTFNIDADDPFTANVILADRTDGSFNSWDGKSLVKEGAGVLTLSAANTYSGTTALNGGVLALSGAGSIASSAGLSINHANAVFDIAGVNVKSTLQNLSGAGGVTLGQKLLEVYAGNYNGVISGTGALTKTGVDNSQSLTLTGVNTYTGATVLNKGTLALSGSGSIASSLGLTINDAGAVFDITALGDGVTAAKATLKSLNGATGTITLGANTLKIDAGSFGGVISGTGGLTKSNTGALTLGGVNTYAGATSVTGGTLTLAAQNAVAQSSLVNLQSGSITATANQSFKNLTTAANTTVNFSSANNHDLTINTTADIAGTLQNIGTFAVAALDLKSGGALANIDHLSVGSGTIGGTLTGVGALTKNTTGVLAINNNITVGALNVTGGGLTIAADKLVNVSGAAQFANGATLTLTLADGYTPLTVNGLLTFDDGSALNIANFSGASYGYKQIIAHGKGGISGMPDSNITGLDTGADYLTTQLNKISMTEGEALEAAVGLTWYDTLTSATGYANAHGTFTVADGGSFTVDAALNKRTGSFDKGWDGASLTKAGNGTLTLTAVNGYDGTTTLTGGTLVLSGAGSIANSSGLTISAGTFNIAGLGDGVTAATATLKSLNGATGAVTLGGNSLQVTSGVFGGVISGTGGLTVTSANGGNTFTLGGVNTYTGDTLIEKGTLALQNNGRLAYAGKVTVNTGATLDIRQITAAGMDFSEITGNGTVAVGAKTIEIAQGVFNGQITGINGGLTKTGDAKLTLGGVNNYSGSTSLNGGVLALNGAGSIAASSGLNITVDDAVFDISGKTTGSGTPKAVLQGLNGVGSVVLGNNTLEVYQGAYSGVITGNGSLLKTGSDMLTLSGVNTYTGLTTINGDGVLALSGEGSIALSDGLSVNDGTFNIADVTTKAALKNLSGGVGGKIILGGKTLEVAAGSFDGIISGAGGLTKTGNGALTLNNVNTYTGVTLVDDGMLTLERANTVYNSSLINVRGGVLNALENQNFKNLTTAEGAVVKLNNKHLIITDIAEIDGTLENIDTFATGALNGDGLLQNVNIATIVTANIGADGELKNIGSLNVSNGVIAGAFTNVGNLNKAGESNSVLTVNNDFSLGGNLTITAGNLVLNGYTSVGGALAVNGGVLSISANKNKEAVYVTGRVSFGNSAVLNIDRFGGSSLEDEVVLISSALEINAADMPVQYTIGGGASVDYLNSQLKLSDDKHSIVASIGLTWNDMHMAGTKYDRAHGTFTLEKATDRFELSAILKNRDADDEFVNIWDGKSLTKAGNGTLVLMAANEYTGATLVNAGTLALAGAGSIADSALLTVANGATFDISGVTATAAVNKLTGGGNVVLGGKTLLVNGDTVANGGDTFGGVISGTGGLTKTDKNATGTILTLTSDNTYTGLTTVSGGSLVVQGGFAANAQGLTVNNGGEFNVVDSTALAFSFNALNGGGTVTLGAKNLSVANGSFSGQINGTGGLTKTGDDDTGVLTLGGVNGYSGVTNVAKGTLALNAVDAIAASAAVNLSGNGRLTATQNQTFTNLNSTVDTTVDFGAARNNLTVSGSVNIAGSLTNVGVLTLNGGTVSGVLSNINTLAKNGTGTLTLSGVNTYQGATVINAGSLALSGAGSIANSSGLTVNAGTFNIAGANGNVSLKGLNGAGGVVLGANDLNVQLGSYGGVISGAGGLTKTGGVNDVFTLTAAQTYSGLTSVTGGTLKLNAANAVSGSSGVTVSGGLLTAAQNQTIAELNVGQNGAVDFDETDKNDLTLTGDAEIAGTLKNTGAFVAGKVNVSGGLSNITSLNANELNVAAAGDAEDIGAINVDAADIKGALAGVTSLNADGLDISGSADDIGAITADTASIGGSLTNVVTLTAEDLDISGVAATIGTLSVDNADISGSLSSVGAFTANSLNVGEDGALDNIADLTAKSGVMAGTLTNTGNLTKTGATADTLSINGDFALSGALKVKGGKLVLSGHANVAGNVEVAGETASGVYSTLSLAADPDAAALTANAVSFGENSILDITGFNGTSFGEYITLVRTSQNILAMPSQYTVGGNTSVDYLTAQLRIGASGKTIEAAIDLAWYDTHTGANGKLDRAHGTFTIADNGVFELGAVLQNRTNTDPANWDGQSLTKKGTGTLTLTSANLYTGLTTVEAGTLALKGQGSIAASAGLNLQNAVLDIQYVNNKAALKNVSGSGNIVLGGKTLEVGDSTSTTFSGIVSGSGSLTKTGSGTLTLNLNGTNNYNGVTTVNGGSLVVTGNFASVATGLAVNNGGVLNLAGANLTTLTLNALNGDSGQVNLGGINLNANFGNFGGVISGSGAFTKAGNNTDTLTFNAAQNYSGLTTVNGGTLNLNAQNAIAASSGLSLVKGTVNAGADQTFKSLYSEQGTKVDFNNNDLVLAEGDIKGSLENVYNLTKTSANTLKLANGTAISGGLSVQNGRLELARPITVAGALTVNGTLSVNVHGNTPAITANAVSFGSGGTLNINGFSGSQISQFITIIASNSVIDDNDMPLNFTIAESPVVDYLSAQLRKSADNKAIEAAIALTWYDTAVNTLGAYTEAHGTFTINSGSFELSALLADRNGTFIKNSWDGKTLTKAGDGVLVLAGANTYTGGTLVNAGTLRLTNAKGAGTGTITNDALLELDFNGSLANALTGDGVLNKIGTGTVIYTGDGSAFNGTTNINKGALLINSKLNGPVNVFEDGVLGGTGIITGNVNVAAKGVVSPGNSLGTLTVNGDLTLAAGALYHLEILPEGGGSDLIAVSGTARIEGAIIKHIGLDGEYDPLGTWTILTANAVEGEFAELVSDYKFLDFEVNYNSDSVVLSITRTGGAFSDYANSKNQKEVAQALDSLSGGDLLNNMLLLTDDENIAAVFDQLSGEIHAGLSSQIMNYDRAFGQQLLARGDSARPGGYPLWVTLDTHYSATENTGNTAKTKFTGGGITLGTEAWVTDDLMLGFAFRYGDNELKVDKRNSKADINSYSAGIYGVMNNLGEAGGGKLKLTGGAIYGLHAVEAARSVKALNQHLKADYTAQSLQLFAELSCRFDINDDLAIQPYGGLAWNSVWVDGFKEKGGYAALKAAGKNNSNVSSSLGVRMDAKVSDTLNLKADVSWRHVYGDTSPESRFAFAGSNNFSIAGAPLSRDTLNMGLSGKFKLSDGMYIEAGYNAELGDRHQSHSGFIKLNITF